MATLQAQGEWILATGVALRLVWQAEDLRGRLRSAACGYVKTDERHIKAMALVRRSDDRISRRRYRYECERDGRTPVTTAQIAAWVRANISRYERFGEADPAEIAGDACGAFALWDEHGSIPAWVWGLCERVAPQAIAEMMRNRCFFVEKPVHYEPDGDILWA